MTAKNKAVVLIINTNTEETDNLSRQLDNAGFKILTAGDEASVSGLLESSDVDVILLDANMKTGDGRDMLDSIKSAASPSNAPVIILSTDQDIDSKLYGLYSGASDYIVKPYRIAEVIARINTQLRNLSLQRELESKNRELQEKNQLLQQLAVTDSLTGLYNRRFMHERLPGILSHSARYREPVTFAMVDIDNFKKTNDRYGHMAGDMVLKQTAGLIKTSIRDVDMAIRYGGEEFLLVCPNTGSKGGKILAERIRRTVEGAEYKLYDDIVKVTVSIGLRSSNTRSRVNAEEEVKRLIDDADFALYRAKANGRNRVEIFETRNEQPDNDGKKPQDTQKVQDDNLPDKYTH